MSRDTEKIRAKKLRRVQVLEINPHWRNKDVHVILQKRRYSAVKEKIELRVIAPINMYM